MEMKTNIVNGKCWFCGQPECKATFNLNTYTVRCEDGTETYGMDEKFYQFSCLVRGEK